MGDGLGTGLGAGLIVGLGTGLGTRLGTGDTLTKLGLITGLITGLIVGLGAELIAGLGTGDTLTKLGLGTTNGEILTASGDIAILGGLPTEGILATYLDNMGLISPGIAGEGGNIKGFPLIPNDISDGEGIETTCGEVAKEPNALGEVILSNKALGVTATKEGVALIDTEGEPISGLVDGVNLHPMILEGVFLATSSRYIGSLANSSSAYPIALPQALAQSSAKPSPK